MIIFPCCFYLYSHHTIPILVYNERKTCSFIRSGSDGPPRLVAAVPRPSIQARYIRGVRKLPIPRLREDVRPTPSLRMWAAATAASMQKRTILPKDHPRTVFGESWNDYLRFLFF